MDTALERTKRIYWDVITNNYKVFDISFLNLYFPVLALCANREPHPGAAPPARRVSPILRHLLAHLHLPQGQQLEGQ